MKLFTEILQFITGVVVFAGLGAFIWWSVLEKSAIRRDRNYKTNFPPRKSKH